jgi:hypothetical protein
LPLPLVCLVQVLQDKAAHHFILHSDTQEQGEEGELERESEDVMTGMALISRASASCLPFAVKLVSSRLDMTSSYNQARHRANSCAGTEKRDGKLQFSRSNSIDRCRNRKTAPYQLRTTEHKS